MRNVRPYDPNSTAAASAENANAPALFNQRVKKANTSALGKPGIHESAIKHVTGTAKYVDDIPELPGTLHMAAGGSAYAHANILAMDLDEVANSPGVVAVYTYEDVPGELDVAPVFDGDPLLAPGVTQFVGQPIFLVVAETYEQAQQALPLAKVEYEPLPANITLAEGLAGGEKVLPDNVITRGDADAAIASATHQLQGEGYIAGQEHFYLEGQISLAWPTEDGGMHIHTSSQHPTEVQKLVAEVLHIGSHLVTAEVRRMGGGFGGKESQAAVLACSAALAAYHLQRPVKYRLPRRADMERTGKRHDFGFEYRIGFDNEGVIAGIDLTLAGLCGCSADLSQGIVDRALFHADNGYYLNQARVTGLAPRNHIVSNTAFRGFGGPQGMLAIESIIDDVARAVGEDPLTVRKLNLYRPGADTTHYGQTIDQLVLAEIIGSLEQSADYWQRREAINGFNSSNTYLKKGLALTPVKFGISFTSTHLNQGSALVHVYTDGTILVTHGGTEMGQGLYTKIAQLVAAEFGVDSAHVQVSATRTDKIANGSPTAASAGTDLNGFAACNACQEIKGNLIEFAVRHFNVSAEQVVFANNQVSVGEQTISFAELCRVAYMNRVCLMAHGFYKTPKIYFDRATNQGHPFYYFANGAACAEVIIDCLTGEYKVERVDILHDVGRSINPALDIGQIEGGFIQGMGWLTSEDLLWDSQGRVISNSPANYKIPTAFDVPRHFHVGLYEGANPESTVFNSKAVGEPPLMLGIAVWAALRDACASVAEHKFNPRLDAPATPEKVLAAVNAALAFTEEGSSNA
ncbi:xanthine dehydrogenase molybdopterin binding subunit [Halioxenophilus sp. WMMB6]|uniref:xanthine dehydrogenase molybdopterin binding subunit n=1 Tax=Halioxenophilus sp. WMMB6 TaxID=3073815 RepID=UPI00295F3B74|nr:xanthine dehydrogenase molybdopterin binding subunit [Halioxenophilus sp. WMMB6]